jgi:hypothetical protein
MPGRSYCRSPGDGGRRFTRRAISASGDVQDARASHADDSGRIDGDESRDEKRGQALLARGLAIWRKLQHAFERKLGEDEAAALRKTLQRILMMKFPYLG